ncbi:MAG: adenosine kinase [Kiloniellaceae bacterium]
MVDQALDVVGIGNAIVDVLAQADEAFLAAQGLAKGAMTLIDAGRAEELYALMGPAVEVSGGSAANTVAGLASLGGRGAFIGKVRNDQLGGIFRHDVRAAGLTFETPAATEGPPTARCLILVTADAQRTMGTYLGASVDLGPGDLDADLIERAKVTYLEGYLWDAPAAKEAFVQAARRAHEAGRKVALSLSDPFCVERHRESFRDLVNDHIDLLFANEAEIRSLYEVEAFDAALQKARGHCEVAVLTRSARGSVILSGEEVHVIDAEPVERVVDTTGAGDLYAAGFLYGYTQGKPLYECGRIASIAAAEVVSHFGARPETPLARLVAERLKQA